MKDGNETRKQTLRPQDVDLYFEVKINEARGAEDYGWMRVLTASKVLWDNDKRMEVSIAQEINAWAGEARDLELMLVLHAEEPKPRKVPSRGRWAGRLFLTASASIGGWMSWHAASGDTDGLLIGLIAYAVCATAYGLVMRNGGKRSG